MAKTTDLTPQKTASDHEFAICGCCAKQINNTPYKKIFLFGIKSEADSVIHLIKRYAELILRTEMVCVSTPVGCASYELKICILKRKILKNHERNLKKI